MSLNRTSIMGRLTANPELRSTTNGIAVTTFTLAVDRDTKDQSGERAADFLDVVAWRSTAEYVCKYFTKGRMAIVDGRIQSRNWTDKDGNKRKAVEIVADSVYFGDSKKDDAPAKSNQKPAQTARPAVSAAAAAAAAAAAYPPGFTEDCTDDLEESDLPF